MAGCKATIKDCTVSGVQGGVTVTGEGSYADIIFGSFSTNEDKGYNNSFHALYVANGAVANIYDGDFSAARTAAQGAHPAFASDEDNINLPVGQLNIFGGRFSAKAYQRLHQDGKKVDVEAVLPDGYVWQAIEGDDLYKWTVVKQ